jgi:quinol-cytochrome oxidoreductase complex cytochrome b subunit
MDWNVQRANCVLMVSIHRVILTLLILGTIGVAGLVIEEVQTGNGCPKIGMLPACFIILFCFLVPLVAQLKKKWNMLYFLFTGLALIIAIIASVMQYLGHSECPKTDGGIPMCYLSFAIFSLLIALKIIQLKKQ